MTVQVQQKETQIIFIIEKKDLFRVVNYLVRSTLGHWTNSLTNHEPEEIDDPSNNDDEEHAWRRKMLAQHKANYCHLHEQLALYVFGEQPLHLLNQIAIEEEAIRRYGGQL